MFCPPQLPSVAMHFFSESVSLHMRSECVNLKNDFVTPVIDSVPTPGLTKLVDQVAHDTGVSSSTVISMCKIHI